MSTSSRFPRWITPLFSTNHPLFYFHCLLRSTNNPLESIYYGNLHRLQRKCSSFCKIWSVNHWQLGFPEESGKRNKIIYGSSFIHSFTHTYIPLSITLTHSINLTHSLTHSSSQLIPIDHNNNNHRHLINMYLWIYIYIYM